MLRLWWEQRRVGGLEFQFSQIKACRFRTFSRPAERSQECSPAELNLMEFSTHTTNSLLPVCHLLDDGSVTSTQEKQHHDVIQVPASILNKSSQSRVFALSSSFLSHAPGLQHAGVPRAHEEELVNLGQLLHRLVSKPSYVSVCGFSLVFLHFYFFFFFFQRYPLSVTGSFSAELQMVNKWVFFFLCTTLSNDPIRIICLNQPPFCTAVTIPRIKLWIFMRLVCFRDVARLLPHVTAYSVLPSLTW